MSSATDPDTTITLHVGLAADYPSWKVCPAPHATYAYDFEGGDYDSNHGFTFGHGTDSSVKWVKFILNGYGDNPVGSTTTCAKYNITATLATQTAPENGATQLTVMSGGGVNSGPKFQVLKDINQIAASGEITVTVTDVSVTPNVSGIVCDPRWENS
jgi:hypothetical protein